jgi:Nucleotide modification associated domain 5
MKLTKTIRDAFVRAAMNDVPSVDYAEQIRAGTLAAVLEILPKPIRDMWNDPKLRRYLETHYVCVAGNINVAVPWPGYLRNEEGRAAIKPEARAELDQLAALMKAQEAQRNALHIKLKGCAESVTTRKALVALLPEFEKYLPADEPAALRTLPVVANVVSDFVKAGWPKGKQPAAA